jgi:hypothetical protein
MNIPDIIKKDIAMDWVKEFPQLTAYKHNKLFKIIGPALVGIEMIRLPLLYGLPLSLFTFPLQFLPQFPVLCPVPTPTIY